MLQKIEKLDTIPNHPYFPYAISREIKDTLRQLGIEFTEDESAIYVRIQRGAPVHNLVIDTHLDHPGFVSLGKRKLVKAIGSIADTQQQIIALNKASPLEVDIFDQDGLFIGAGNLSRFFLENGVSLAILETNEISDKPNLQILPKINYAFQPNQGIIKMRSADNQALTGLILEVIDWLNKGDFECDATFVFSKLEEIRQATGTRTAIELSQKGIITPSTVVIVLEAGLAENNYYTRAISNVEQTYEGGPILRLGDQNLPFDTFGFPNLGEAIALSACLNLGVKYQHAPSSSNANTTPYFIFGNSPNVIGITVPCQNKHNMSSAGMTHEIVKYEDLVSTLSVLKYVLRHSDRPFELNSEMKLTGKGDYQNLSRQLVDMRKTWMKTASIVIPRLRQGHLVPEGSVEILKLALARATNYFEG